MTDAQKHAARTIVEMAYLHAWSVTADDRDEFRDALDELSPILRPEIGTFSYAGGGEFRWKND